MKFQVSSLHADTFEAMDLSARLLPALENMGIQEPTDIQSRTIPVARNGDDLIAVAQTGSGKTLSFALPVLTSLEKRPSARALILAPSREMAQQMHKVFEALCRELPISVSLVIGGLNSSKQTNQLKKLPRLIIATPGRMNDHLVKNKLLLQNVEFVVIDEADRMLDMGFAPQLKQIEATLRGQRQTLMFSASFGKAVESIAQTFLRPNAVMIRASQAESPVESLEQKIVYIEPEKRNDRLLDELNATKGSAIVFTGNQASCEDVAQYLKDYGFAVDLIHGGLSQGQRNRVMREFRNGELRVVVATDLLARGLDVPEVEHVINYDLPFQAEDFLHRIGRTARAGRSGRATTFITPKDEKNYGKIATYLSGAEEIKVDPKFQFKARRPVSGGPGQSKGTRTDKYADKAKAKGPAQTRTSNFKASAPKSSHASNKPTTRPSGLKPAFAKRSVSKSSR